MPINCFFSLFLGLWLIVFPESPKFLLEHGESDKALEILTHIFIKNTGKSSEEYPVIEGLFFVNTI